LNDFSLDFGNNSLVPHKFTQPTKNSTETTGYWVIGLIKKSKFISKNLLISFILNRKCLVISLTKFSKISQKQ